MAECSNSNDELITATFHVWKYGHYFKVVEEGSKNIKVRCTLCPPNKTLSSARNTTSSFKAHLARVHKNVILVAKEVLQVNGKGKRKKVSDDQHSEASQPKKQCTISSNSVPSTRLCNLLSECIIKDMLPLSTVESPAFQRLIGGLCCTQVPDRKSFTLY